MLFTSYAAVPAGSVEGERGALSGGAALVTDNSASGDRAVRFNGSTASGKPSSVSRFYGVNWHPMWINAGGQNAEMDLMQQAGIKAVRIDAEWYSMESSKGVYPSTYLSRMDNAVDGLVARGIEPEIVVTSTPTWVTNPPSGDPDPSHEPPVRSVIGSGCDASQTICTPYNHAQDFDDFLTFLIKRWKGKVHDYEIWNEPDGYWAWRTTESSYPQDDIDRGADYATLLKSAYPAAKAADPSVTIIGGVLSNTQGPQQYMLQSIYDHGAGHDFDVYAQHYYCDPPGHNWCNSDRNIYDPQTLANTFTTGIVPVLKKNGDGSKPVWVDETGYNTYTSGGGVSEATQATYLTQTFTIAKSLPNVARLYWYDMDESNTGTSTENYYGLIAADMSNTDAMPPGYRLKPAYAALKALTGGP